MNRVSKPVTVSYHFRKVRIGFPFSFFGSGLVGLWAFVENVTCAVKIITHQQETSVSQKAITAIGKQSALSFKPE